MKRDGGQAFPSPRDPGYPKTSEAGDPKPGMSLRDYFAGQALQGIIACVRDHTAATTVETRCAKAYEYADAMLAARSKI